MLHCGLHAVNAILQSLRHAPYTATEMDAITRRVHQREQELCPDGRDTEPQECGNYPLETLIVVLRLHNLSTEFEKPLAIIRNHFIVPRNVVGFLLGTGDHYVSIVRGSTEERWRLIDNGRLVDTDARSPFSLIARMAVPPRVVLRVISRRRPL